MKRHLALLFATSFFIASCSDGGSDRPVTDVGNDSSVGSGESGGNGGNNGSENSSDNAAERTGFNVRNFHDLERRNGLSGIFAGTREAAGVTESVIEKLHYQSVGDSPTTWRGNAAAYLRLARFERIYGPNSSLESNNNYWQLAYDASGELLGRTFQTGNYEVVSGPTLPDAGRFWIGEVNTPDKYQRVLGDDGTITSRSDVRWELRYAGVAGVADYCEVVEITYPNSVTGTPGASANADKCYRIRPDGSLVGTATRQISSSAGLSIRTASTDVAFAGKLFDLSAFHRSLARNGLDVTFTGTESSAGGANKTVTRRFSSEARGSATEANPGLDDDAFAYQRWERAEVLIDGQSAVSYSYAVVTADGEFVRRVGRGGRFTTRVSWGDASFPDQPVPVGEVYVDYESTLVDALKSDGYVRRGYEYWLLRGIDLAGLADYCHFRDFSENRQGSTYVLFTCYRIRTDGSLVGNMTRTLVWSDGARSDLTSTDARFGGSQTFQLPTWSIGHMFNGPDSPTRAHDSLSLDGIYAGTLTTDGVPVAVMTMNLEFLRAGARGDEFRGLVNFQTPDGSLFFQSSHAATYSETATNSGQLTVRVDVAAGDYVADTNCSGTLRFGDTAITPGSRAISVSFFQELCGDDFVFSGRLIKQ